jgi:hypothetical protein
MKKKNYLEPSDAFDELLICLQDGNMSEKLGGMIIKISEKYVNHPMFNRYVHLRQDLIANGIMACVRSYTAFRPDKNIITRDDDGEILTSTAVVWNGNLVAYDYNIHNSPFTFFTTCIRNANLQLLKKEYKQKNIINGLLVESGEEADFGYTEMMKQQEENERSKTLSEKKVVTEEQSTGIVW